MQFMPNSIDQLSAQRDAVLTQLKSIDRLRRGTLSRQVFAKKQDGRTVTQGPYFVLQGFQGGIKFSQRIPASEAERVQEQVDNFKHFQALADQCISLTDQITQLAEGLPGAKKNFRSRKSKPSNSGKPTRS
jgi:hypothetical protein